MTDFSTDVALDFGIESGALGDVRSEIESELDSMPITAADAGGGLAADGGAPLSGLGEGLDSLVSLAEDRNTILAELREALDAQALESAQGGGGGGILPIAGGASAAGGLGLGLGGLATVGLPGLASFAVGKPLGDAGIEQGRQIREEFDIESRGPEAGRELTVKVGDRLTSNVQQSVDDALDETEFPAPPDPFAGVDWPDIPDLPDFSWPDPPSLPEFGWPEVPGLPELSWPEPPDPFRGLSTRDWPSVPNPFANLAPRDWPSPPNPFAGFSWPKPPDPFAGFDWPDPPDLSLDLSIDIGNLGRTIEQRIREILRAEFDLDIR